jgi:hypothetical protein
VDLTQWSTIAPYVGAYPAWAGSENQMRLASYQVYESMYWNVPEAFKLIQRGSDTKPIYIPAARQIIETMQRYLAPSFSIIPDPEAGTEAEQQAAMALLRPFVRRERFYSKFSMNKRYGLIRGDWLFHIFADSELPEGSRISIEAVDPGSYFPIYADDEVTIIGCHLVDFVIDERGDTKVMRQTYRKVTGLGGPSPITRETSIYEVDAWGGPGQEEKRLEVVDPIEELPPGITSIPVYHFPNAEEPGTPWGSSELRGIERMLAAINQSISDEEIELVLNGLGVYVTDAGSPINETTGEPMPWNLGPAKVIELPNGKKFERVTGTSSVQPHQEHLKYLHDQVDLTTGASSAAKGKVDVQVAESGISLALQMAPIFSRAEEKELIITDKMTQLLFDLRWWFEEYEGQSIGDALWIPSYGDRLPLNRKERFNEVMTMFKAHLVSGEWARSELTKIGYVFGDDTSMLDAIATEATVIAQVESDVTGARMDEELDDGATV